MAVETVRIKGLRELNRALKNVDNDLRKELERYLLLAAQQVADDARSRFTSYDAKSAGSIRARVRGFGKVVVEQRRGKTTGQHPEFGSLQMRTAFLPALREKEDAVIAALENMLDSIGDREGF